MRLVSVALLLLAGIFAGAQLGKIAPLVGWYRDAGFSLVLVGWLTSAIGLFVALCALPVGWAVDVAGARLSTALGAVALAAGALALPFLVDPAPILATRLVEGVGYVVLVVSLPALLAAIALPQWRATVLALWNCFVPVGYAVSDLSAQAVIPAYGPRGFLLVMAAGFVAFAIVGVVASLTVSVDRGRAAGQRASIADTLNRNVVVAALGFGLFVIQTLAFLAFMPARVEDGHVLLLSPGLIALATPLGNVLAGVLVRGAGARAVAIMAAAAFAVTALTAWPAFTAGPAVATVAALLFMVAGGFVSSALFAVLPVIVGPRGSVSIAIGLAAQAGGLGTFFGPPLAGLVIEAAGWSGLGLALSLIGIGAAALVVAGMRRPA